MAVGLLDSHSCLWERIPHNLMHLYSATVTCIMVLLGKRISHSLHCHALNQPRNLSPSSASTSTFEASSPTIKGASPNMIRQNSRSASPISSRVADAMPESEKIRAISSPITDMSEKVPAAESPVGEIETSEKMVTHDQPT